MTGHHLEQLIGMYVVLIGGSGWLVYGLHKLGHRDPLEPRLPRCVVRATDYLTSFEDCTDEPQQVTR